MSVFRGERVSSICDARKNSSECEIFPSRPATPRLTESEILLRLAPGVNVARIDGNKWAIAICGFNFRWSNKLLVLVDGRTFYNRLLSGGYGDLVERPDV